MKTFFAVLLLLAVCLNVCDAKRKKLAVDLYAEALCPYCQRIVSKTFAPLFENGLYKYMDLHFYYAGNMKMRQGKLECQHGETECYLNKVLGCGMARKSRAKEWFPFVECIESHGMSAAVPITLYSCASKVGLSGRDIVKCAKGKEGEKIQKDAYDRIQALRPPHRWVPWAVIDGVAVEDDIYKLQDKLCAIAPRWRKPRACYSKPPTQVVVV